MILSAAQVTEAGVQGGWAMGLAGTVHYSDLDAYNHVNNKIYHTWFENLRVCYVQGFGLFGGESPYKIVVRRAGIEYHAQMLFGEDYITGIRCSRIGNSSFDFQYGVFVNGELRTSGDTQMVLVNETATKSMPLTDEMRLYLEGTPQRGA
ncbi:thioesterase [Amylibacter marinus]|uniref:Thioesterase n=1 Tax=Amylibacter marinus TaxID=1475483 RepID=A0ABQ5VTR1_9RHOB|nr:thioesterase family protein [Amylibacter marinus]GLQ34544.1 thioesterase [Amylibacter marinus]